MTRPVSNSVLSRVFLTLDRSDDDMTITEIAKEISISRESARMALNELVTMKCVKFETIVNQKGLRIFYPTGHQCYYCKTYPL